MKIGFDAKRALHNFRGLGNYSRTLIKSLDEFYPEHEYYLLSPEANNKEIYTWLDGLKSNVSKVYPSGLIGKTFPSLWRSFLLKNEIRKCDLDIYHGLSHELPIGIKNTNALKIVTIHDLLYLKFPHFFSFIDRQTYHRKFTYSCRESDIVIAICEQTKKDIVEYLKVPEEKIHVIYQSCSSDFYEEKSNEELSRVREKYNLKNEFIFHIATMEENKNTLGIVKAFNEIHKDIEADLILIGRGKNYKQQVINFINENKLNNRIRILDEAESEDIPAIYQLAKLFVFPSFYEGFGIPIIEALFSKTPVITSVGSCFPESGGPHSKYINPHSIEELSSGIIEILKDDELQKEMAQKGHEFVQKFHWKNTSKELMNLYLTHL